jgi:outer membrane protein assembly factor BamB
MKLSIRTFFVATALLPVISSIAGTTEWPQFRGPNGQGHAAATHLPIEWNASKNVAWKQVIPGRGWSSPVISQGRIFLTSAVPSTDASGMSLRSLALESGTGTILWNVEIFQPSSSPGIHQKNSHASPTPVLEGDRVFVHFGHQGTACLDRSGAVLWRNESLRYEPVHGNGGSPAIVGDALIFSCDGGSSPFLVALNKNSGAVLWKTARSVEASKTFSFSTPLAITVNGRVEVLSPASNMIGAYDPLNGRELWKVRYDGYSVIPRPVFGHGLIYFGTGYDRPSLLAIKPGGTGDVTDSHVVWRLTRGAPNTPSPLLVGDELYIVSDAGMASCLEARTGQSHWQERLGGNCSASPVFADGKIYVQNEEGVGFVLKPGKEFQKLAANDLGERSLASLAVAENALFIRTAQHLYRIQQDGSAAPPSR